MNEFDLTGKHVSETYPRIVQHVNGIFYDGLGATIHMKDSTDSTNLKSLEINCIEGSTNEVQNPFSSSIINVVNGGSNSVRELGSFSINNIIDTNF